MKSKFEARKSLGQHFLRSEKAIGQIISAIDMDPMSIGKVPVFEIGPGEGVLTQKLLEVGHKVCVIEIDKRSIEVLEDDFRDYLEQGKLTIINRDCLEVDYTQYLDGHQKFSLVGNIPYYITGAIFRHTFEQSLLPGQAIFLVQKEVAQRVIAKESGKEGKESLLSISVKIFTKDPEKNVEVVDYVKAGSFSPPPKVDSAILNIKNIQNPFKNKQHYDLFFEILKAAFSQKRKFLMSNLKQKLPEEIFGKYRAIFEEVFLNKHGEKVRAEDIGVKDWLILIPML